MFIAKNNDLIILAKDTREELEQALQLMVYTSIEETDIEYELYDGEYLTEEEIKVKERERLDSLTLTPADVERALYKARQMDFEDLKALIVEQIPTIDIKGLSIEFRAKDFYRGAMANGMRLFDVVGALLGYNPSDMDYLFENKELPEKEEPTPEPEPTEPTEPTEEPEPVEEDK
jgi:hypothetical protein